MVRSHRDARPARADACWEGAQGRDDLGLHRRHNIAGDHEPGCRSETDGNIGHVGQ